jgi:hypothetical protein
MRSSQRWESDLYSELEDMGWKWCGLQKLVYYLAIADPVSLMARAKGVWFVYMWSAYVFILKWSLEPLFCTGQSDEVPEGYMITRPSILVRSTQPTTVMPFCFSQYLGLLYLSAKQGLRTSRYVGITVKARAGTLAD